MTEAEWMACTEVRKMLEFLRQRGNDRNQMGNDRKLRLLAVNSCRRIWGLLTDERSRNAVLVAERFADGLADDADLHAARIEAADAWKTLKATQQAQYPDPAQAETERGDGIEAVNVRPSWPTTHDHSRGRGRDDAQDSRGHKWWRGADHQLRRRGCELLA